MSEALVTIDVPGVRPPNVTPKQWRLAALLPRAETAYQALIDAGYRPSTAAKQGRRASVSVGVQRATQAIAEQQRDRAREIRRKVSAVVEANVKPDMDEQLALATYATVSKIASEYPEDEAGIDESEHARAAQFVRLVVRFALAASQTHELSDDEIDAIAARSPQDLVVSQVTIEATAK